jgi:HEAT repeat protein
VPRTTPIVISIAFLFGIGATQTSADSPGQSSKEAVTGTKGEQEDVRLRAYLKELAEKSPDLRRIDPLVRQLGDDDFDVREEASRRLGGLGAVALPALRLAIKSSDAEIARRAAGCIETIEKQQPWTTPLKAVQRLLARRPPETIAALLEFLPSVADPEIEEAIYFGLTTLLEQQKNLDSLRQQELPLDASLIASLSDKAPAHRALAGLLVGRFGDEERKVTVRKLLNDSESVVRLRVAQGLLADNDKSGIPTLISLLEKTPTDIAWQAEELLHYAAAESMPTDTVGMGSERERKACRESWEGWWRDKGDRLTLANLKYTNRRPRLLLVFEKRPAGQGELVVARTAGKPETRTDHETPKHPALPTWNGRIWLCGCEGQPRNQAYPFAQFAAVHLPVTSNRTAVASGMVGAKDLELLGVLQLDAERVKWEYAKREGEKVDSQFTARLANGNSVMALEAPYEGNLHRIVEVDREERTLWESIFEGQVGALVVWPLVRVGFSASGRGTQDLHTVENRLKGLKSPDRLVRRFSLESLQFVEHTEATFHGVVDALEDEDPKNRLKALRILRNQADVQFDWPNEGTFKWASAGPRTSEAIPSLIRRLDDPDETVRSWTGGVLMGCGMKAADAIITLLNDSSKATTPKMRREAVSVLGSLFRERDPKVIAAIHEALRDKDPGVRSRLIEALLTGVSAKPVPHVAASDFTSEFIAALEDPNDEVATAAQTHFHMLGEAGSKAVPYFLKRLDDPKQHLNALRTLAAIGPRDPRVLSALIEKLTDGKSGLRIEAITALDRLGPDAKSALPALRKIVEEEPGSVASERAAWAIKSIDRAAKK